MKKGFTLIELLAVIVLLGIIAVIVVPAVDRYIRKSQNSAYDAQIEGIVAAVKNWEVDHPFELPKNNGEEVVIYLSTLKVGNYVREDLINPKTEKPFSSDLSITITNVNGRYTYVVDGE